VAKGVESRVRLKTGTRFQQELRAGARAYFEESGRGPGPTPAAWARAVIWLLLWICTELALLSLSPLPGLGLAALAVVSGLATTGIIFNVHHDGGHGAWSDRRWVNAAMATSFDFVGMSSYLWRLKHNRLHHSHPNVDGFDDDIDVAPFARMAPSQPWRPYHRLQHVYLWFLYPFHTLKWIFVDDLREVWRGQIGRHPIARPRGVALGLFVGGKVVFATWALVLPAAVHGAAAAATWLVLSQLTVGLATAVVFQLAHAVEEAARAAPPTPEAPLCGDWAVLQVRSTVDFARGSRFAAWCLGGLNHQVVHHLFPGVSHVHYPALSKVVAEVCGRHGVPYDRDRSAWELLGSHHRWLRQMGRWPQLTNGADRAAAA